MKIFAICLLAIVGFGFARGHLQIINPNDNQGLRGSSLQQFSAENSLSFNVTANGTFINWSERFDFPSDSFNETNGVFTALSAGVYIFQAQVLIGQAEGDGAPNNFQITKLSGGSETVIGDSSWFLAIGGGGLRTTTFVTTCTVLSAGDQVYLQITDAVGLVLYDVVASSMFFGYQINGPPVMTV